MNEIEIQVVVVIEIEERAAAAHCLNESALGRKAVDMLEIKFHGIGYIAEIRFSATEQWKHEKEEVQQAGQAVFRLEHNSNRRLVFYFSAWTDNPKPDGMRRVQRVEFEP